MLRLLILIASCGLLTGCEIKKPEQCYLNDSCGGGSDAAGSDTGPASGCMSSADCHTATLPACDTVQQMCVTCSDDSHGLCTGTAPRCEQHTCVACADDTADCQGGVCLLNGACADTGAIIHATPNGSTANDCGSATTPCTFDKALTLVMSGRNVIKLDSTIMPYVPNGRTFTVIADVTIDMRGATLNPHTGGGNDGPILAINGGKTVTLLGGTIQGSNNGEGIRCDGNLTVDRTTIAMTEKSGIAAMGSCNLSVTHATITDTSKGGGGLVAAIVAGGSSLTLSRSTLQDNRGGGLTIGGGKFIVIGNMFLNNGSDPSTIGGISISAVADLASRLEFNTVIGNTIMDGPRTAGIDCIGSTDAIGRNNIVWKNKQKTVGIGIQQISGLCKQAYSNIGPSGVLMANDGQNNFNDDPRVMNEQNDLRLQADSPDIGHADPAANLMGVAAKDINGVDRKARAGMGADIGAYQYRAP